MIMARRKNYRPRGGSPKTNKLFVFELWLAGHDFRGTQKTILILFANRLLVYLSVYIYIYIHIYIYICVYIHMYTRV